MIAVIDQRTPKSARIALQRLGLDLCPLPLYPKIDSPVSGHPDMLLFFARDAIITSKGYAQIAHRQLQQISDRVKLPIVLTEQESQSPYPYDIALNAAVVGDRLFCYPKHTAKEITERYEKRVLPVRQGYAKCSTLPIGFDALITEDPSVETGATRNGFDVLRIQSGHVRLDGYPFGFIGGASSCSPYQPLDCVLFCGDPDTHPDAESIRGFCKKYNQKIIPLGSDTLYDVGTIFLI